MIFYILNVSAIVMRRLFYWMLCLLWMFVVAVFGQSQPGHFLSSYTDNEKSCDCPMVLCTL